LQVDVPSEPCLGGASFRCWLGGLIRLRLLCFCLILLRLTSLPLPLTDKYRVRLLELLDRLSLLGMALRLLSHVPRLSTDGLLLRRRVTSNIRRLRHDLLEIDWTNGHLNHPSRLPPPDGFMLQVGLFFGPTFQPSLKG